MISVSKLGKVVLITRAKATKNYVTDSYYAAEIFIVSLIDFLGTSLSMGMKRFFLCIFVGDLEEFYIIGLNKMVKKLF